MRLTEWHADEPRRSLASNCFGSSSRTNQDHKSAGNCWHTPEDYLKVEDTAGEQSSSTRWDFVVLS